MEFTNEFTVPAAAGDAWSLLTDVPRVAPCLPGASVEPLGEDAYSGTVAVKVGPIRVGYAGTATFREIDPAARRMVLDAQGRESTGKGTAAAVVTVQLHDDGGGRTRTHVHTDLRVTGKVAQFGRTVMADVGERLIGEFAGNLETLLGASNGSPSAPATPADKAERPAEAPSPRSELDALALAGPVLKRALPAAAAFLGGVVVTWVAGRLRGSPAAASRAARCGCAPS